MLLPRQDCFVWEEGLKMVLETNVSSHHQQRVEMEHETEDGCSSATLVVSATL